MNALTGLRLLFSTMIDELLTALWYVEMNLLAGGVNDVWILEKLWNVIVSPLST